MEALIAALIGWVTTADDIINLQTGLRVRNMSDEIGGSKVEICFPDGSVEDFDGPDADAILDRCESLVTAGVALTAQLDQLAAQAKGVPQT